MYASNIITRRSSYQNNECFVHMHILRLCFLPAHLPICLPALPACRPASLPTHLLLWLSHRPPRIIQLSAGYLPGRIAAVKACRRLASCCCTIAAGGADWCRCQDLPVV